MTIFFTYFRLVNMKKFLVFLGLFYAFGLSAQYKYQIKANLLVRNGGITNGFNLGFETLHKKTNFLIDFQTFGEYPQDRETIIKENQVFKLTKYTEYNSYLGVNLGVITSLTESDKYSLSGGFKVFLGINTKRTFETQYTLDSGQVYYRWRNNDVLLSNNITSKQSIAYGAIPFIRMDAKLSSRFFLIPEVQLPLTGFANKKLAQFDFNIGFNISLAYRFSKKFDK
jgi:hypothetical protein